MYQTLLVLHNLMRWMVLILGIYALYTAFGGRFQKKNWTEAEKKAGLFFSISLDTQVAIGVILYLFFSPLTHQFMFNFKEAAKSTELQFFGIEHTLSMLAALALLHIGNALVEKTTNHKEKYKIASMFYAISFLVILAGIPWERALFPGF